MLTLNKRQAAKAQYTTPTQLNCRVELRRRCVLNSQLVEMATVSTSFDESEQFADNEVELRSVGGVNAPVVSGDPVSNFLRQSHIGCRIVNWVTTPTGVYTPPSADTTQLDSTRQLSRVGVGGVYWALRKRPNAGVLACFGHFAHIM